MRSIPGGLGDGSPSQHGPDALPVACPARLRNAAVPAALRMPAGPWRYTMAHAIGRPKRHTLRSSPSIQHPASGREGEGEPEARGQRSDVRGLRSEVRGQRSGSTGQKPAASIEHPGSSITFPLRGTHGYRPSPPRSSHRARARAGGGRRGGGPSRSHTSPRRAAGRGRGVARPRADQPLLNRA